MLIRSLILAISLASISNALRILVSFPLLAKSHSILGHGVVTHLLKAGHEVVHITAFPKNKSVQNLTEIDVSAAEKKLMESMAGEDYKLKNLIGKPSFGDSPFFLYITYSMHRELLEDPGVVKFLADPKQKFDIVIAEWFFSETSAGLAPLFQCPLIWFATTEAHWQILQIIDGLPNPAYSVDLFSANKLPLSFSQRVYELWMVVKKSIMINLIFGPLEKMLYNKVFSELAAKRGVPFVPYSDAVYNSSLTFLNSHPSLGTAFSLPQNAKYVAGYHIDSEVKPLPKDLQTLMDEAKHGIIYFSMGSNVKSVDMPEGMKASLLKMFGKLKQTVIWKFEEDMDSAPPNIHFIKWAPQQSILAHPNVKFFITQGGQLSTTEAIHYGVPVIGMPVLGDQYVNMQSVSNKGLGLMVQLADDVADRLYTAIQKMLTNPSYNNKAKEISAIYHDRSIPAGQELVYWVEYVARTHGASHLKSPALQVTLYQKLYLDLLILIIAMSAIVYFIVVTFLKKKRGKKEKSN